MKQNILSTEQNNPDCLSVLTVLFFILFGQHTYMHKLKKIFNYEVIIRWSYSEKMANK